MKLIVDDFESFMQSNFGLNFLPPKSNHCLINGLVNVNTMDTSTGEFEGKQFQVILNYFQQLY